MSNKSGVREVSSLTDRITALEVILDERDLRFAHLIASGVRKYTAFIDTRGYTDSVQLLRLMKIVEPLVMLLKEETSFHVAEQLNMSKEQRLEHILETALVARARYDASGEAAHGAVYLKAMQTINQMTGDNAATEVHHLVSISHEQLEAMSHRDRTEAYKRMMNGNLKIVGDETKQPQALESKQGLTMMDFDQDGQPLNKGGQP